MAVSHQRTNKSLKVDEFVLTAQDVANKFVTLSGLVTSDVAVDIQGGTSQVKASDFLLVGNKISWDGLGLEPYLAIGDNLRVTYQS